MTPFFTNDSIVLGLLMLSLAFVFITSSSSNPFWKKFYTYCPALLLCYFIPALLHSPLNLISSQDSKLYFVASNYLLPACLVLLCISIDLKGLINLGSKSLIMFFTATLGIIIGAPVSLLAAMWIMPEMFEGTEEVWRGMAPVAGSWIGGSANQTAMREIYQPSKTLFQSMLVVDIVTANIWMGFLLYGAGISKKIDAWLKADSSAIEELKDKVEKYRASIERNPTSTDLFLILAVGFGATGFSQWITDLVLPFMKTHKDFLIQYNLTALDSNFFWLVVIATTIGFLLSFTKVKELEGVGASKVSTVFIYVLVATIGMEMDVMKIFENLGFFFIGIIWMSVHVLILLAVAKLIKAPFFFVAVGSQANIGGAASAPVVASAFSPALAPVGVLMAVLGYALGTYGGIVAAQLMQFVSK
ncbi:MAG: DUF819 family protein [Bacteroidetes bacterium]|nr:MAG: DUF819 family protein [Bacteroidota bacterium]